MVQEREEASHIFSGAHVGADEGAAEDALHGRSQPGIEVDEVDRSEDLVPTDALPRSLEEITVAGSKPAETFLRGLSVKNLPSSL